ncbi:hypothetical protein [Nonomuraea typhae]|uniref:hypothetical protein n=1 Tax=Nonomuraea typhae TaxID=2603600 RepID=UPI0012F89532|nr:hypothetical protein [Nonomuraea typhae]
MRPLLDEGFPRLLAEFTGGGVFHDGLGELQPARAALRWVASTSSPAAGAQPSTSSP